MLLGDDNETLDKYVPTSSSSEPLGCTILVALIETRHNKKANS